MVEKVKEVKSVVKIDPFLLVKVEEFIKKDENKFRFTNKKQLIDIAVNEFLENEKKRMKNGKKE